MLLSSSLSSQHSCCLTLESCTISAFPKTHNISSIWLWISNMLSWEIHTCWVGGLGVEKEKTRGKSLNFQFIYYVYFTDCLRSMNK